MDILVHSQRFAAKTVSRHCERCYKKDARRVDPLLVKYPLVLGLLGS